MGKFKVKRSLKQLQIEKHALQMYVKREGASPDDLKAELKLLQDINDEITDAQSLITRDPDRCPSPFPEEKYS